MRHVADLRAARRARGHRLPAEPPRLHLDLVPHLLVDKLPHNGTLDKLLRIEAQLHQEADREEPEDGAGGPHGKRPPRREHGRHRAAHAAHQVGRDHPGRALLLLNQFAEDVEEKEVAGEVLPVGVAEDARDELVPLGVPAGQPEGLHELLPAEEPHREHREVDRDQGEGAVVLEALPPLADVAHHLCRLVYRVAHAHIHRVEVVRVAAAASAHRAAEARARGGLANTIAGR
mmetsp:Transcript_10053/g.25068  ORF Transcript_10053/g.25068 Transcript_10053/m.25068 type:complete len:232 (+) Transcript_10053:872-1567(+)